MIRVQRRKHVHGPGAGIIERGINLYARLMAHSSLSLSLSFSLGVRKPGRRARCNNREGGAHLRISLHLCDNVKLAWLDKPVV